MKFFTLELFNFNYYLDENGNLRSQVFAEDMYVVPRKLFNLHCLWPLMRQGLLEKLYLFGVLFPFLFAANFICAAGYLVYGLRNGLIHNVIDVVVDYIFHLYTVMVMVTIHGKKSQLKEAFSMLENVLQHLKPHNYARVKKTYHLICFITTTYAFLATGVFFLYVMRPVIYSKLHAGERTLIFFSLYPFNEFRTPNYELMWIFQSITVSIDVATITASIIFSMSLLTLAAGFFDCVSEDVGLFDRDIRFLSMDKTLTSRPIAKEYHPMILRRYASLIQWHRMVIKYAELVRDFYGFILFSNVLAMSLILCIVGWQILELTNIEDRLRCAILLAGAFLDVFLNGYLGTHLKHSSINVSNTLFHLNWQVLPKDLQIVNKFMITRSQKPVTLVRSKFGEHSFESVIAIFKTAWTYLTMLKIMQSRHEMNVDHHN